MIQYLNSTTNPPLLPATEPDKHGWVRIEQPTKAELTKVIERFGLEEDILIDALDPHEIPRLERENGYLYFITRLPDTDDDFNDFTTPILFIIHPDRVITLSRDSLARLWEPYVARNSHADFSHLAMFAGMMEAIIQSYYKKVFTINRQMRAVTADITKLRPREISIFVEYERKLNDYVDALIPTNAALKKALVSNMRGMNEAERDAVEDLSVELEQIIARCKSLLRTITNVRDSFRTVMDTQLNETIRLLTVITLALTVPTMISGLFGMNVNLPWFAESPLAFWIVLIGSLTTSGGMAYYFLYRRH